MMVTSIVPAAAVWWRSAFLRDSSVTNDGEVTHFPSVVCSQSEEIQQLVIFLTRKECENRRWNGSKRCFVVLCLMWFFSPQALQALGFVLSGDGDVDSLSSDEKSDSEGKNDRMSSSSGSITSSTDTQEVRMPQDNTGITNTYMWGLNRAQMQMQMDVWRNIGVTSLWWNTTVSVEFFWCP